MKSKVSCANLAPRCTDNRTENRERSDSRSSLVFASSPQPAQRTHLRPLDRRQTYQTQSTKTVFLDFTIIVLVILISNYARNTVSDARTRDCMSHDVVPELSRVCIPDPRAARHTARPPPVTWIGSMARTFMWLHATRRRSLHGWGARRLHTGPLLSSPRGPPAPPRPLLSATLDTPHARHRVRHRHRRPSDSL